MTRDFILTGYVLAVAGFVALTVLGRTRGSKLASASNLLAHVLQTRASRFGLLVVWWWLGWHYLAG